MEALMVTLLDSSAATRSMWLKQCRSDIFANDYAAETQSKTIGLNRKQGNYAGLSGQTAARTHPVPGAAWRGLARDSMKLLDDIISI